MPKIIDGYEQFFQIVPKNIFFSFGLDNIITINPEILRHYWNDLKTRITNKKPDLYIRKSGQNGSGNNQITQMYKDVFGIQVRFDPTNNALPQRIFQELSGQKKNVEIFNYQVSHVFGRTKNVFAFTAPWNIVRIPKIIDPFTGHEAKGQYVQEFQQLFQEKISGLFLQEIEEYNLLMHHWRPKIEKWLDENVPINTKERILKEFEDIELF